jgi:hypothetical protein
MTRYTLALICAVLMLLQLLLLHRLKLQNQ